MSDTCTTPRQALPALVGLLAVAAAWGMTFPLTKELPARVDAVDFLAQRYTLAAVVMLAVFGRQLRRLSRRAVIRGAALGALFRFAQIVQTAGLAHTSASASGIITGMYVVLTPVCATALLRTPIAPIWWLGAGPGRGPGHGQRPATAAPDRGTAGPQRTDGRDPDDPKVRTSTER